MTLKKPPETRLLLQNSQYRIRVSVESVLPRRFRRQLLLEILNLLDPHLPRLNLERTIESLDKLHLNAYLRRNSPPCLRRASKDLMKPGIVYRLRRLELGLSLRALSRLSLVSYSQLSRLERGLVQPSAATEIKLRRILYADGLTHATKATIVHTVGV
jgi:hypothetical protein